MLYCCYTEASTRACAAGSGRGRFAQAAQRCPDCSRGALTSPAASDGRGRHAQQPVSVRSPPPLTVRKQAKESLRCALRVYRQHRRPRSQTRHFIRCIDAAIQAGGLPTTRRGRASSPVHPIREEGRASQRTSALCATSHQLARLVRLRFRLAGGHRWRLRDVRRQRRTTRLRDLPRAAVREDQMDTLRTMGACPSSRSLCACWSH